MKLFRDHRVDEGLYICRVPSPHMLLNMNPQKRCADHGIRPCLVSVQQCPSVRYREVTTADHTVGRAACERPAHRCGSIRAQEGIRKIEMAQLVQTACEKEAVLEPSTHTHLTISSAHARDIRTFAQTSSHSERSFIVAPGLEAANGV